MIVKIIITALLVAVPSGGLTVAAEEAGHPYIANFFAALVAASLLVFWGACLAAVWI